MKRILLTIISVMTIGVSAVNAGSTPSGGGSVNSGVTTNMKPESGGFRVAATTDHSISLTWTAPANDGDDLNSGSAAEYDLRFSTQLITEANFLLAPRFEAQTPGIPGTTEALEVTGLNSGTNYYFAIKTADHVPNWSGMSNVVMKATSSNYLTSLVSQTPTSVTLIRGQTYSFSVTFKNEGSSAWYNNSATHPGEYAELRSCTNIGNPTNSFLNEPFSGSLGWISAQSVCTMQESVVAPTANATFTFTGKVDANAVLGTTNVYFRVYHSTGGVLAGWGNMHFTVNVVASPTLVGTSFQTFEGRFNHDSLTDHLIWNKSTGDVWVALRDPYSNQFIPSSQPWLLAWAPGSDYDLMVGDFSHDGFDDICVRHKTLGRWFIAYNWDDHFAQANGTSTANSWIDSWMAGSNFEPFAGDFSGDGYCDIGVREISTGRVYIAYNWDNHFTQANGTGVNNCWVSSFGIGSNYQIFVGHFNGDNKSDLLVWNKSTGSVYVALRSSGSNSFSYSGTPWLSGWAPGADYDLMVGDFSHDGFDDICVRHKTLGRWFIAYNWDDHFAQANGTATAYSWINSWFTGSNYESFAGDFSGDGYCDIGVREISTGRWFIAYNWNNHFTQANGIVVSNAWLDAFAKTSGSAKVTVDSTELISGVPKTFALSQNYPNPFNPTTTIEYTVPTTGRVTLIVYNLLGQTVKTLVDEDQQAGDHRVTFDGSTLASGVYLYRLQSDSGASASKKMLLLK